MRGHRERLRSTVGPCVLLALVAAASVGLNTDFASPPRFDGAGYAVLGEALASGRGYREIDVPGAPRHAHFPPAYPAALALVWRASGRFLMPALCLACGHSGRRDDEFVASPRAHGEAATVGGHAVGAERH